MGEGGVFIIVRFRRLFSEVNYLLFRRFLFGCCIDFGKFLITVYEKNGQVGEFEKFKLVANPVIPINDKYINEIDYSVVSC